MIIELGQCPGDFLRKANRKIARSANVVRDIEKQYRDYLMETGKEVAPWVNLVRSLT